MCGIAGIYNFKDQKIEPKILKRMILTLRHRGPDGEGYHLERNIGLANRRLAILDLTSAGEQPMSADNGNLWITFNGEIFNYLSLRDELIKLGYKFKSHTDTEVILNGFKHLGEKIVEKLLGQFAFCIYDRKKQQFFLARDHIGINPLFYSVVSDNFIFASELKSILASQMINRELDLQSLYHYLSIFSIPAPLTIIKGVKILLPGHYMFVNKKGVKIKRYWQIPQPHIIKRSTQEIIEILQELLKKTILSATVADVPIAAFLSGGIDSSVIVALMAMNNSKRVKTYSLWAEGGDSFDERYFAGLIAKKYQTDHTEMTVTDEDVKNDIENFIYYLDQPNGESLESYFLSKNISKSVKVALTGIGGDELFAGYHRLIYLTRKISYLYHLFPKKIRNLIQKVILTSPLPTGYKKTLKISEEFINLSSDLEKRLYLYFVFNELEKKKLFQNSNYSPTPTSSLFTEIFKQIKSDNPVDKLAYLDLNTYTRDNLLLPTNMTSMAHSLEIRVPLLDKRLIEFAFTIPADLKFHRNISKYIFKLAVKDLLPEKVITHKKTGFGLPRYRYMKGNLKPLILEALDSTSIHKRGIFNEQYVHILLNQFYNADTPRLWTEHLRIWILFVFEMWCRLYIDD